MKKILILAGALFITSSCKKDFVSLTPEDSYSADNFFKTESQFRQAVVTAYQPLRNLAVNDFYTSEMRSDNTHYELIASDRGPSFTDRESIANFVNTSTNTYTNAVYFHCYSGISKANIVIDRLKETDLSEAAKMAMDGQVKFLRAFNYFKLVRLFGGVPLYLKEVKKADDAFVPRSSVEEVYNQIIADAKDAINELAAPAKFPQSGEATKGSATMLLTEVYMTQKKYAEAETLLSTLAGMGYALNANYADAFAVTNKNGKESIFEIQFLEGTGVGSAPSNFIYQFLPRTTTTVLVTGVATNNTGTGGWNTPTQDLINTYEANDKRLDASIGVAEGVYNPSNYLVISANKSIINYTPASGKIGVPYIKKYLHPHTVANNTNDNWPLYRYADALLMLAEARNEQGKSGEALDPLNAVRIRAGLPAITTTVQAALRDIIAHERRVELAFENHRWHDLVRTGKAIEAMNAYGVKQKQLYNYLTQDTYNVTTNSLLLPIPESEIGLNPELTQNPGYGH